MLRADRASPQKVLPAGEPVSGPELKPAISSLPTSLSPVSYGSFTRIIFPRKREQRAKKDSSQGQCITTKITLTLKCQYIHMHVPKPNITSFFSTEAFQILLFTIAIITSMQLFELGEKGMGAKILGVRHLWAML